MLLQEKNSNINNIDSLSELGITKNNLNNVENISFLNPKKKLNR